MRGAVFIMILLILGALFIANKQQTDFKSINSSIIFAKLYGKWVLQIARNVKELAIVAYNMRWLPDIENVFVHVQSGVTALNVSFA